MADAQGGAAAAPALKKGAFRESEQHEKAYQIQKGIFVFGKSGARKEKGRRAKHVSGRVVTNGRRAACTLLILLYTPLSSHHRPT
jgi:hypothetical protein